MTYVVLARKWRPQKFADLVGQEAITRTLENAIRLGRVSHALLFTGARGVGKTTSARILAKALNCEKSDGPTTEPCGECSNCREIAAGTSVDVREIDGASNTSVDDIRELKENVRYRPQKSRTKIYIIDEVHMLSTSAFNALLKTLEEPPPGVMFMFATTDPHKIPDTILSRCQRFDFKQISDEQIRGQLRKVVEAEKITISENALSLIARQAAGSLRDSLSLLDQVIALAGETVIDADVVSVLGATDRELIARTLTAFIAHDSKAALTVIEDLFSKGFDPKNYLLDVWERVRDLLVLKSGAEVKLIQAAPDELAQLQTWAAKAGEAEIERWFDLLRHATESIGRSEFPRYVIEVAFLKAARDEPRIPLSSLVDRLESLEKRLGGNISANPGSGREVVSAPKTTPSKTIPVSPPPAKSTTSAAPSWETLVNAVKRQKPAWAAILLQAANAEIQNGQIRLSYDEGSFYQSRAKDADFQAYLVNLARELFGESYALNVRTAEKSMAPVESPASVDRAREREALENPLIQRAVSLFDAKIEAIKPSK